MHKYVMQIKILATFCYVRPQHLVALKMAKGGTLNGLMKLKPLLIIIIGIDTQQGMVAINYDFDYFGFHGGPKSGKKWHTG